MQSYNADRDGNWTTAAPSGVVDFGNLSGQHEYLNAGKIKNIFGDRNGNVAFATASGTVLLIILMAPRSLCGEHLTSMRRR